MNNRSERGFSARHSAPPTRPSAPPRIALVIAASLDQLESCHRSATLMGAIALECDVKSAWLAAFAWSPFAIVATEAAFLIDGDGLKAMADGTGARLLRLEELLPDEGTLDIALRLALDRWNGPATSTALARIIPMGFG